MFSLVARYDNYVVELCPGAHGGCLAFDKPKEGQEECYEDLHYGEIGSVEE